MLVKNKKSLTSLGQYCTPKLGCCPLVSSLTNTSLYLPQIRDFLQSDSNKLLVMLDLGFITYYTLVVLIRAWLGSYKSALLLAMGGSVCLYIGLIS